jgi:hypothetical protein
MILDALKQKSHIVTNEAHSHNKKGAAEEKRNAEIRKGRPCQEAGESTPGCLGKIKEAGRATNEKQSATDERKRLWKTRMLEL